VAGLILVFAITREKNCGRRGAAEQRLSGGGGCGDAALCRL
jgi:hypothetical protein